MLSRKQLGLAALGVAVAIAVIVGAIVGTQNQSRATELEEDSPIVSLEKCSGEACPADPAACRSKFGFCGVGEAWCNDNSTWRPEGCTVTVTPGGVNCTGQPCMDMNLCRSEYGYCGTGSAYCNPKSIWNPEGCLSTTAAPTPSSAPTTTATTTTTAPTTSATSSLCSGEACAAGQCRSEWGYCGTSPAYCNAKSTYTPSCPGAATLQPTIQVTNSPTLATASPTTASPTASLAPTLPGVTNSPTTKSPTTLAPTTAAPTQGTRAPTAPTSPAPAGSLSAIILARQSQIGQVLLQSQTPSNSYEASKVYKAEDLEKGVRAAINGIAGMTFIADGVRGRLNIAAFLAQSMKETIKYDVCDENNWDLIGGTYPASNACGQLGQSYSQYHCSEAERMMECPIDVTMEKKAATNAKWYGAPAPLFCAPRSKVPLSPGWNYGAECNQPWANPPKLCTEYDGQKAGAWDYSRSFPNMAGRTEVEGCCWWGRGVIQLTGPCNVGKLNYFLGKAAYDRGLLDAPFPDVDFCREPDAICASTKYPELKWVSGFFYWMRDVQEYNAGGWNYQSELNRLAADPNNANLRRQFINGVSGIVNRGSPFSNNVDGGPERSDNFEKAWAVFGPEALALSEGGTGEVNLPTGDKAVVPSGSNTNNESKGVDVIGGVVGGVAALVVVGTVLMVHFRRQRQSLKTNEKTNGVEKTAHHSLAMTTTQLTASNPLFATSLGSSSSPV